MTNLSYATVILLVPNSCRTYPLPLHTLEISKLSTNENVCYIYSELELILL